MLSTQTTKPRFLTIVSLVSKTLEWDSIQNCTVPRDCLNVELTSDSPLSTVEVNQSVKKYIRNGYLVTGVSEVDFDSAADWF
jgi:hypothetical protein